MANIAIRNIPDDVMTRFKERAKAEGKSAEQLAREAITEKAKPSREEIMRRMDEIRSRSRRIDGFDIVAEIRRDREERDERITAPSRSDAAE
jgi:plasmid stability protein